MIQSRGSGLVATMIMIDSSLKLLATQQCDAADGRKILVLSSVLSAAAYFCR
ncbi:hypothetical protein IQ238_04340 [Pleurocapsales cyanobacterium LEGE 06147]|nr:hypothetical protein [Pleurocapsales cyanobacterium LEGE 06147]